MDRIEQIKAFLLKTPKDDFLNYALAIEYVGLEDDEEALKQFLRLCEDSPDYYATYYHLGKLYERMGEEQLAIDAYEKGMEITKRLGEKHAFGELRSALEELTF
jgi:Tfp pilus assembly protein PilF